VSAALIEPSGDNVLEEPKRGHVEGFRNMFYTRGQRCCYMVWVVLSSLLLWDLCLGYSQKLVLVERMKSKSVSVLCLLPVVMSRARQYESKRNLFSPRRCNSDIVVDSPAISYGICS
jgi:hypothetical protein